MRVFKEEPAPGSNGSIRAAYKNKADYRTRNEWLGAETVAEALKVPGASADTAYVWRVSEELLLLRFTKGEVVVAEKKYALNKDFHIGADGRIEIALPNTCGFGEAGGGCGWGGVTIFENASGQLVVVQSIRIAMAVGLIVPIAIHAKNLSLFSRSLDAPPFNQP